MKLSWPVNGWLTVAVCVSTAAPGSAADNEVTFRHKRFKTATYAYVRDEGPNTPQSFVIYRASYKETITKLKPLNLPTLFDAYKAEALVLNHWLVEPEALQFGVGAGLQRNAGGPLSVRADLFAAGAVEAAIGPRSAIELPLLFPVFPAAGVTVRRGESWESKVPPIILQESKALKLVGTRRGHALISAADTFSSAALHIAPAAA